MNNRKAYIQTQIVLFLEKISLYKHQPKLNFRGKEEFSTWQGGLLSLLQIIAIASIVISVLQTPFKREIYTINEESAFINETSLIEMKLKDLSESQLFRKLVFPIVSYQANQEEIRRHECNSQVQIGITVDDEFKPLYTTKIFPRMRDDSYSFCVFTPPAPQHFSDVLQKGYENEHLFKHDIYGTFFAFSYRFLNASNKEIWLQTDLASIAEQSGIHYYRHFIPILYQQNQEAMVSFRGIFYGDTQDIYGKFDGFFDYLMTQAGLRDHYITRFLFENENLELSQYPIPELGDNKVIYDRRKLIYIELTEVGYIAGSCLKIMPFSVLDSIQCKARYLAQMNIAFIEKAFFCQVSFNTFTQTIVQFKFRRQILNC